MIQKKKPSTCLMLTHEEMLPQEEITTQKEMATHDRDNAAG